MAVKKGLKLDIDGLACSAPTTYPPRMLEQMREVVDSRDTMGQGCKRRIGGITGYYDVIVDVWRKPTGQLMGQFTIKTKAVELEED